MGGHGGREEERIITSLTETVHVLFHTGYTDTARGWRLKWSSSPALERDLPTSGYLTSPNYPGRYPEDYKSFQKIQVPEGNTIWIRFYDFDCEKDEEDEDTVTITDKDGTRLGFFDGDYEDDWRTKEMVSNTDTVEVQFQTGSPFGYK